MSRPEGAPAWAAHAGQYRAGLSSLHRLPTAPKLLACLALVAAAVYLESPLALAGLLALDLGLYAWAGLGWRALWPDMRFWLAQTVVVVGLFWLKDGRQGLLPGALTGLRVMLFFLPGLVASRTTSATRLMADLERLMPARVAFLAYVSLRYLPFFARELKDIAQAQRLRGARLGTRQMLNPLNWGDLLNCLMIPLMVRALQTASEAALAAQVRGLGGQGENSPPGQAGDQAPAGAAQRRMP
ncbi:MAG: energy-coupling factor transporter transmembrane component T [Pseudomonadota bacterium]